MHDLVMALVFSSMVAAPAVVAAISGRQQQKAPADEAEGSGTNAIVRQSSSRLAQAPSAKENWSVPTLPLHRTLGMAGR